MKTPLYALKLFLAPFAIGLSFAALTAEAMQFTVPQEGFHSKGPKLAYLEDVPEGVVPKVYLYDPDWTDKWEIRHGRTVYKVKPEEMHVKRDINLPGPGMVTWVVDFTPFNDSGRYELRVDDSDVKEPVVVSEYIYWDVLRPVVKTFYWQRCGQDVEDVKKNYYHLACHQHDALLKSEIDLGKEDNLDTAGGWHNGTDYSKQTTATSIAVARLLSMYDLSPKAFKYFKLEYPYWEPGISTVPDLLLENKTGLDWLMAMQQLDGGVYSKVAAHTQSNNVFSPDHDTNERYVYDITTQDTAAAAGAFAIASRTYKDNDLGYAVRNLMAAQRSWKYLENHAANNNEQDLSFRVWAAAELYLATGDEKFHKYFLANYKKIPFELDGWRNPAIMGIVHYVQAPKNEQNPEAARDLRDSVLKLANQILADTRKSPYRSGLKQYTHESNYQLLERTGILISAYRLTNDDTYRTAASHAVDYLFGINPLNQTFITGLGKKPVQKPHHPMMMASRKLIEGYIVSGPDTKASDGRTPKGLGAASYKDDPEAHSVNQTSIVYNAELAYVLGALNAAYNIEEKAPNAPPETLKEKMDKMNREDSGE